ncbi:MAG: hypothetical protein DMG67_15790 [Acidobacteria bacterium]|nr:MAG: hypothetical protein DMG67_15790 [Acidobacteriota bacterium]
MKHALVQFLLMTDEQTPPQPEPEFKTEQPKESTLPWPAIAIGGVFIIVVVGLFIVLAHKPQRAGTSGPSAYAANINLQNAKLSQAENFMGGTVTYIEGQVANTGDKTVTRATVEATFQNSMGETVEQEELPLQILDRSGPYPQALDLQISPLKPQQPREFRLTLSHISADWNQQAPRLKVMMVETQ